MFLLDQVVQASPRDQLNGRTEVPFSPELDQRGRIRWRPIYDQNPWYPVVGTTQGPLEEAQRGHRVPLRTQEKLHRLTLAIHGPIEIDPAAFLLNVGFIHMPAIQGGPKVAPDSPIHFWGVGLDPPVDCRGIHLEPPLRHHLLQVPVAQGVGEIPPNAEQDQ